MDESKKTIGLKEFVALIILTVGTKFADDTPSILYEKMDSATWMAPLIIGLLFIVPIISLTKVMSLYPGKNLIDIALHLFGKSIGLFILFILWLFQTYALIVDSSIYVDIIGTMYFTKTPLIVIYSVLMFVAAYGAKKGIEHIVSFAWTIIIIVKISSVVVLIMTFLQGQFSFLFPLFGPGRWEIVKESTSFSSIFADFLYFTFIASFMKSTKVFNKGIWFGLIFVVFELSIAIAGFVLLFDYPAVKMMNYPFHEAIRDLQFGFFTNIESLFFPFWLISSFARFSFYLYICAMLFGTLFKIRQFEYLVPILATVTTCIGMLTETPTHTIFFLREKFLYFITPFVLLLPFIFWLTAKLKGEFKKNEKEEYSSK